MRTSVLDTASADLFAALIPGVTVIEVEQTPSGLLLTALALTLSATCPRCGTASTRVHSYYTRRPRDLPVCGLSVHLLLHVRRFRCLLPTCPAVTFTERLPELLAPAAQRTNRLNEALRELALAFGGEAGAVLRPENWLLRIFRAVKKRSSGGIEDALTQELKARPPVHLALHHLQPRNLAFYLPRAPR